MSAGLRPGGPSQAAELSAPAFRAKAHWGYDDEFMDACRAELTVTPADFTDRRLMVADLGGTVAGFAVLDTSGGYAEVVDLWVDPLCMGAGVGRALWDDAVTAAAAGHTQVRVVADPHAEGFYAAMGARLIGEAPSESIPGRMLPLLALDL